MIAYVWETDIPGLVDVTTEDGEQFRDLTFGQIKQLTVERQWELQDGRLVPQRP